MKKLMMLMLVVLFCVTTPVHAADKEAAEDFKLLENMTPKTEAVYRGILYEGDRIDTDLIAVESTQWNDRYIWDDAYYTIDEDKIPETIGDQPIDIVVDTIAEPLTLTLDPITLSEIIVTGNPVHEGEEMDLESLECRYEFENGVTKKAEFEVVSTDGYSAKLETRLGLVTYEPDVIPVESAEPAGGTYFEGDSIEGESVTLTYADGYEKTIAPEDVVIEDPVLSLGENRLTAHAEDLEFCIEVEALPHNRATDARVTLADELENADKSYVSETTFVTLNTVDTGDSIYRIAHILVADPERQLCAGLSHDSYGGDRETPSSNAARNDWIIGTNASNFAGGTPDRSMGSVIIKEGEIMLNSGSVTNGREICMTYEGELFSPGSGVSASSLIERGVVNTFLCGDTELIMEGQAVNVGVESYQYRYPRCAIGMVEPGEYYMLVAGDSRTYDRGMTYTEVRGILLSKGCTFGKCMDGGGSADMVFLGNPVRIGADGKERPVTDFLYVTD